MIWLLYSELSRPKIPKFTAVYGDCIGIGGVKISYSEGPGKFYLQTLAGQKTLVWIRDQLHQSFVDQMETPKTFGPGEIIGVKFQADSRPDFYRGYVYQKLMATNILKV